MKFVGFVKANPFTSGIGAVLIIGSVAYIGLHTWQGNLTVDDLKAVAALLTGAGFIAAQDAKAQPPQS